MKTVNSENPTRIGKKNPELFTAHTLRKETKGRSLVYTFVW